jgi:hypothetical protein
MRPGHRADNLTTFVSLSSINFTSLDILDSCGPSDACIGITLGMHVPLSYSRLMQNLHSPEVLVISTRLNGITRCL